MLFSCYISYCTLLDDYSFVREVTVIKKFVQTDSGFIKLQITEYDSGITEGEGIPESKQRTEKTENDKNKL